MAETRLEPIAIKSNSGEAKEGELSVQVLAPSERMARAVKILAICWVLAVVTAFIPIAHFFLVPLFALAGPIMAFMKYRAENITENAKGICPECGKDVTIELDAADQLPKWTYCPACNKPLQLVYRSGAGDA